MTMLNIRTLAGDIQEALPLVSQVALDPQGRAALIPLYSHLLISAEPRAEQFYLTAFDGSLRLSVPVACRVSDPGVTVVRAQQFADYIRNLDKGAEVVIQDIDGRRVVKTGRMRTTLNSDPGAVPDNWPNAPGAVGLSWLRLPPANLYLALERVRWTIASNDARPALTGVLLKSEGNTLRAYGGDGFRVSHQTMTLDEAPPEDMAVVLPGAFARVAVDILSRAPVLSDDYTVTLATLWTDGRTVALECMGVWLASPLVEAAYPNLDALLAYRPEGALELPKQDLMNGLQAADVIARENSAARKHLTVFDFDSVAGCLRLEAVAAEVGKVRVELAAKFDYSRIGYQTRADWLRQAVQVIPDEWHTEPTRAGEEARPVNRATVKLRFHSPASPLVVSAPSIDYWSMVPPFSDEWVAQFERPKQEEKDARPQQPAAA